MSIPLVSNDWCRLTGVESWGHISGNALAGNTSAAMPSLEHLSSNALAGLCQRTVSKDCVKRPCLRTVSKDCV